MGSHYPTQTDVVLIARNRKTNLDEQNWPVMRMIDHGVDFIEFGFETQVEPLPLKDRVNPFDILLWRKARPLLATPMWSPEMIHLEKSRLTIMSDGAIHQLHDSVMSELITKNLNITRRTLPPYFIEGASRGGVDPILDVELDPKNECEYDRFKGFYEYVGEDHQIFWIARATCDSEYAIARLSMYLMVPKVK